MKLPKFKKPKGPSARIRTNPSSFHFHSQFNRNKKIWEVSLNIVSDDWRSDSFPIKREFTIHRQLIQKNKKYEYYYFITEIQRIPRSIKKYDYQDTPTELQQLIETSTKQLEAHNWPPPQFTKIK